MSPNVIEGTWEEIKRHEAELTGRQLLVIITSEQAVARGPRETGQNEIRSARQKMQKRNQGEGADQRRCVSQAFADNEEGRNAAMATGKKEAQGSTARKMRKRNASLAAPLRKNCENEMGICFGKHGVSTPWTNAGRKNVKTKCQNLGADCAPWPMPPTHFQLTSLSGLC